MVTPQSTATRSPAPGRTGAPAVVRLDPRDESGQAIVEAVLVLPAMIFLILMILQLTMLQHARIMTEYAAFAAARAGIVLNANDEAMTRAAELALLPTVTRVGSVWQTAANALETEKAERARNGVALVEVTLLSPCTRNDVYNGIDWGEGSEHLGGEGTNRKERDFDDIRPKYVNKSLLTVGVQYNYRMKIPFANRMLQAIYFAGRLGTLGTWRGSNWLRPEEGATVRSAVVAAQEGAAGNDRLRNVAIPAGGPDPAARRFYFPLYAKNSMRMQSNLPLGPPRDPDRDCIEEMQWPP